MSRPVIFMLEADDADRFMAKVYFDENKIEVDIDFLNDSDELFLKLENCEKNKLRYPALILVNIKSVPLNAIEILKKIKTADAFRHIPVIVLSGSKNEKQIKECYKFGASSFIQKPDNDSETSGKITNFIKYWFETVEL